jgi:hypothetical protein
MWGFVGYAGAADGSELPVGIMLDMLAGSASGLLQRDFALGAQLAQSLSIHSPAVFGWGFARHLDRTKRGPAWPSVKREQRDVIQAQLLCCRRTGG